MVRVRGLTEEFRKRAFRSALQAARDSAAILYDYFWERTSNSRMYKGTNDIVTTADLESCRVIKAHLKKDFPSHSFLFEEPEYTEKTRSDYLWVIDPLDGTTFHNRGLPFFSCLIALQVRGTTEFGLAYTPFSGDVFSVWRGKGGLQHNRRFRIEKTLHVSKTRDLKGALIGYSYGKSENHLDGMAVILKSLLPCCRALTRVGGADIGYVAGGNCDAFIDNSSTAWDFAGLSLMVREAGGRVTDFDGKEWNLNSQNIVASNSILHSGILNVINSKG